MDVNDLELTGCFELVPTAFRDACGQFAGSCTDLGLSSGQQDYVEGTSCVSVEACVLVSKVYV